MTDFKRGYDHDFPANSSMYVSFEKDAVYSQKGQTHGLPSHAIKHYQHFDRNTVKGILDKATVEIRKHEFWIKNAKNSVVSNSENSMHLNYDIVLNTLDFINDKIYLNQELLEPEKKLQSYINQIVNGYSIEINRILKHAIDLDSAREDQIRVLIKNKSLIKFRAKQRNSNDYFIFYYEPSTHYFMITTKNGKMVKTLFKYSGKSDISSIVKTKEIKPINDLIDKILRESIYEYGALVEKDIKIQADRSSVNIPSDRKALQAFVALWKKVWGSKNVSPDKIDKYKTIVKKIQNIDSTKKDESAGIYVYSGKKFKVDVDIHKIKTDKPTPWVISFIAESGEYTWKDRVYTKINELSSVSMKVK